MFKSADEFPGVDIREVWDWRLSKGNPILLNSGPYWQVMIYENAPANKVSRVLDHFNTQIPTKNDPFDREGVAACYAFLHNIRDRYARDHIELRKPVVKMINEANKKAAKIFQEEGALASRIFVEGANAKIHAATKQMHAAIKQAESQR